MLGLAFQQPITDTHLYETYFIISPSNFLKKSFPTFNMDILYSILQTDRYHYIKSGNIQKLRVGDLIFVAVLRSPINPTDTKCGFVEQKYLTGSMPLPTPNNSLKTKVSYREHALAYSQQQFQDKSILQGACPCLLPTTVPRQKYPTGSMPLPTPNNSSKTKVSYREHALAYSQQQFQDKSILQGACPCLLPTTVPRQKYLTGSMPLPTPNNSSKTKVSYKEHAFAYSQPQLEEKSILQGACPCLLPTTVRRQKYLTGSMPLYTPNHSLKTKVSYREHALVYSQPQS